jgi:hypothetical protein
MDRGRTKEIEQESEYSTGLEECSSQQNIFVQKDKGALSKISRPRAWWSFIFIHPLNTVSHLGLVLGCSDK